MSSDKNNSTEDLQLAADEKQNQVESEDVETREEIENDSENLAADSVPESPEPAQDSTSESQSESEITPESSESKGLELLQQELERDKQKITQLHEQLKKVEERIEQARRTNIFGRPQSGQNERERDKLTQEIKDTKQRIAENESAIESLEG